MKSELQILYDKDLNFLKQYLNDSFDTIIMQTKEDISKIISRYLYKLKYELVLNTKNYKDKDKYVHYEIIYKYLPYVNHNIKIDIIINISTCMYGQKLLINIKDTVEELDIKYIEQIVNISSYTWTFPIFLYYLNILNNHKIKYSNAFIINNYSNTDDRIYKYMINNHSKENILNTTPEIIKPIIQNIFRNNIPTKYILRRLKYLNNIFNTPSELGELYFNDIFNALRYGNISINLINKVLKYYYNNYNHQLQAEHIIHIITLIKLSYKPKENFISIYDLLKTNTEKNKMVIYSLFLLGTSFNKTILDGPNDFINLKKSLSECIIDFIDMYNHNYNHNHNYINYINNIEFKNMVDNIGFSNISSCLIIKNINNIIPQSIYFLIPFMVACGEYSLYYNRLRYNFSKYIKNIRRKKLIIKKLKLYPIIKELNNKFSSSNNKQGFNYIPPYHLYPGQLNSLNNTDLLLKEKADGVLAYNLPNNIYPKFPINNKLKAEYMEDLDLYLVFDIDIDNDIQQRHLFIHNNHNYGQKEIPIIYNEEEMIYEINKERIKLKEFLKLPYDNYRWYPKPAWKIININNFIVPFINIINNNYEWLTSNNCDGLILTPLKYDSHKYYNYREIKIKPKDLYTIDLLYKDNKWIDRSGYEWDIINPINININNNTIWRCYPQNNLDSHNYKAIDIRYDKSKPNTHEVVINIMDLYKLDYKYEYNNIYHDNKHYSIEWKKVIECNNKIINNMINKLNIKETDNILDCGCGSGRIISYFKKFNSYIGVDMDIKMIGHAINNNNYYNYHKINFMYCDLNNEWPLILNNKFDIIIIISSIMHFCSYDFWSKLNNVSKKSTKLLINIVDININNYRYEFKINDEINFIERKGDKLYYKYPIHNSIKEENYIDINIYLDKYGWNVIETFQPDYYDNITQFYKWYHIIKI
jgi:SAM-dependent methyltransferase